MSNQHDRTTARRIPRTMAKTIFYIQYTNPACYPPLEHSSRMLADRGWHVHFLGAGIRGVDSLVFPPHPRITLDILPVNNATGSEMMRYAQYARRALSTAARLRPRWIYASEPLTCPIALALRTALRVPVVYHEHDSPSAGATRSRRDRVIMSARAALARSAEVCVLPQHRRMELFLAATRRRRPTFLVPNVPERREIAGPKQPSAGPLTFYYHGTLNALRLPFAFLEGLAAGSKTARLIFAGYETAGSTGFVQEYTSRAAALGLAERVHHLGPLPERSDLLTAADGADVGLALMPTTSQDVNLAHMVGASNKPFDYLARGLALCVSDIAEWREMYVDSGLARYVDPSSPQQFADLVAWCDANREAVHQMGERGRKRIAETWNYEHQFAPVLDYIETGNANAPAIAVEPGQ